MSNDLSFDQRLLKKAASLQAEGYDVRLVGRRFRNSSPAPSGFKCRRFRCWFNSGVQFYAELNLRIFFYLMWRKWDVVVSNDADTLFAGGLLKIFKGRLLVYDSHELFTEVPELKGKDFKRKIWHNLQKWIVPKTNLQITVGEKLALRLTNLYGGNFVSVRNTPNRQQALPKVEKEKILIYQGALNLDRGLELAIEALPALDGWHLWIAGQGRLEKKLKDQVAELGLGERVRFLGRVEPHELHETTCQADIGLNMLSGESMNYYYSLANKFFDYVQAEIPGISMAFPEYRALCGDHEVAILCEEYSTTNLISAVRALSNENLYQSMKAECNRAAENWIWPTDAQRLIKAYKRLLPDTK